MKYPSNFSFDCDMGGGLIISSKQWFDDLSEQLAYSLMVVLDIDGNSELIYDFLGQSWNDVWLLEANKWLSLANSGIAASIILREGTYNVTMNLDIHSSNIDKLSHFSNLKVEDNEIYIAEADDFLTGYSSDILKYEDEDFERINIPSGFYKLYCTSKEDTGSESAFNIFFHQVENLSHVNELVYL